MHFYKKCFLILILVSIIFLPVQAQASTIIKAAGDENYPPYEFVDKNGIYKGFNIDIMKAISSDLGVKIEIVPMSWSKAIKALDNGRIDIIQGMNNSNARDEKYNFTKALLVNSQAIFVRKETNNISELNDLAGAKVAIESGDISEEFIKKIPHITIMVTDNQEQAIKELLQEKVDAFLGDRLTGLYILQKQKKYDKVKIIGDPIFSTNYCSVALKKNKNIIDLLNKGIDDIKSNGTYDKIYKKWFGESIIFFSAKLKNFLIGIIILCLAGIIIVLLTLSWNRSLKKLVALKTGELEEINKRLKMKQEKLDQSNRLRGKILENILDGIIAFDQEGNLLGSNIAAKGLLNIDIDEDLTIDDINFERYFISGGYKQALQGSIWRRDLEWQKEDGEILNIDCNISPIKGPDGRVEGVIIVLHDYTESKLLNEAREYDKLKTEFFANISHELRTPISVISASSQLLKLKGKTENGTELSNLIDRSTLIIKQNINRLTRLINNIIDITKADTGFLELQLSNYNIIDLIEGITASVVDYIENKGLSIQFDTDIEEKIVACDADKVERILLNLLSNSVKFTREGGNILVKISDGEKFITVSVIDNGIGIPKDKQELVFERFRQVDKSISRSNEGSGIGLSLVKSLVELHGGSIKVKSVYGIGSEFIITFPVNRLPGKVIDYKIQRLDVGKTEIEFSDIY